MPIPDSFKSNLPVPPHYLAKARKMGQTIAEVDKTIYWLTGYNEQLKTLNTHSCNKFVTWIS